MSIVIDAAADTAERDEIEKRTQDFTSAASPTKGRFTPFGIVLRDTDTGALRGGIKAVIYGHWMFLEAVFVDAELRGQGWGLKLLAAAEDRARAENLVGIWLDTFDFQAPAFYDSAGFERFGTLDDYPRGHKRLFFKKLL